MTNLAPLAIMLLLLRMRSWRNRHTRTFEGRVLKGVRVQVPSTARCAFNVEETEDTLKALFTFWCELADVRSRKGRRGVHCTPSCTFMKVSSSMRGFGCVFDDRASAGELPICTAISPRATRRQSPFCKEPPFLRSFDCPSLRGFSDCGPERPTRT